MSIMTNYGISWLSRKAHPDQSLCAAMWVNKFLIVNLKDARLILALMGRLLTILGCDRNQNTA